MDKILAINKDKAKQYGLNLPQAIVYDWFCRKHILMGFAQLVNDLPLVSRKADTFYRHCESLVKTGAIKKKTYTDKQVIQMMRRCGSGCIACGSQIALHRHHYPKRAKDGGQKTVTLCANHHALFHHLADRGVYYIPTFRAVDDYVKHIIETL